MPVSRGLRIISTLFNNYKCISYTSSAFSSDLNRFKALHTTAVLAAKVSFKLSDIGEGIREVAVKEWFVKVGDKVSQFDNICEVQSDKASVTITSRYDGVITKLYYSVDDVALVGKPLVDIETKDETTSSSSSESDQDDQTPKEPVQNKRKDVLLESPESPPLELHLCIPSVRRLAKENNIILSEVKGTGKNGRILKEDVLHYMSTKQFGEQSHQKPQVQVTLSDRTETVKGFQKAMVKTMTESLKIPHFVYSEEIDLTELLKIRNEVNSELVKFNINKMSFLPYFIKAASLAMTAFPVLNASVDEKCETITYRKGHNFGVAMDTKVGLAVPVIRNVENLTIRQISEELHRLMKKGKEGTFTTDDLSHGTFTISNIGIVGGTYMSPKILPPQVAIVALGAVKTLPRFNTEKEVVARDILTVSAAGDHRIVDGATMARYIETLKQYIERPYYLLVAQ